MQVKSPRGVQQTDVNGAADELLSEQLKPTIERVRMKLGRGSPNTVGPMLEVWFSSLGERLRGPTGESDKTSELPATVQVAMKTLWKSALQEAHSTFEASKVDFANTTSQQEQQMTTVLAEIETERGAFAHQASELKQALDALHIRLAESKDQANKLQMLVNKKDEELTSSRLALQQHVSESNLERRRHDEQFRAHSAEIQALQTQFATSERRLMTEMDRERQQVKKLQTELELERKKQTQHKNEAWQLAENLNKQLHELNIQNTLLSERASGYLARLNDALPKKSKSVTKRSIAPLRIAKK